MESKRTEYKGCDVLQIWDNPDDKRPVVSFGRRKARAIVECFDEIKVFAGEEANGDGNGE
jgi:hypothetical protein